MSFDGCVIGVWKGVQVGKITRRRSPDIHGKSGIGWDCKVPLGCKASNFLTTS